MNSPTDDRLFDEHDLLVRQAMDEVSVPLAAKVRARQCLDLATLVSSAGVSSASVGSIESNSNEHLTPPPMISAPSASRLENSGNWLLKHRRLASSVALAASLLFAAGIYFLTRPLDHLQLVAISSQLLDERLESQPAWVSTERDELLEWIRTLNQMPQSISQISLPQVPLGTSGRLWKLVFAGREDLYVMELRGSAFIQGVGKRVKILQSSSNRWSVAARQDEQHLLVFMTKGNLAQYLQLVPLA